MATCLSLYVPCVYISEHFQAPVKLISPSEGCEFDVYIGTFCGTYICGGHHAPNTKAIVWAQRSVFCLCVYAMLVNLTPGSPGVRATKLHLTTNYIHRQHLKQLAFFQPLDTKFKNLGQQRLFL